MLRIDVNFFFLILQKDSEDLHLMERLTARSMKHQMERLMERLMER